jgi:NEDD8-activating enzyme E1 regulatory subunit
MRKTALPFFFPSSLSAQRALMNAKICLLHASATGAETLKNLVLPGVGDIAIVDDVVVSQRDVYNNFFVTAADIGKPRAQAVLDNLLEMNDDVKGSFVAESPAALIASKPDFFAQFALVIATQMPLSQLAALSSVLSASKIPLLAVRTYGLIGYLRLYAPEHTIVELKPQSSVEDLRIVNPWPELRAHCDDTTVNDLATLNDMEHKHTPYVVLLIKALDRFQESNGTTNPPSTFKEKHSFKELLRGMSRGSPGDEENFDEAVNKAALASKGVTGAPSAEVLEVLNDPLAASESLTAESDKFWWAVAGIKHFFESSSTDPSSRVLPLSGELPDMTATTDRYITLQKLYQAKHNKDVAVVWSYLHGLMASKGIASGGAGSAVPAGTVDGLTEEYIREVCKNARFLRVVRHHSIEGEAKMDEACLSTLKEEFEALVMKEEAKKEENEEKEKAGEDVNPCCSEIENSPLLWYCALRAADSFYDKTGKHPQPDLDGDAAAVLEVAHSMLTAAPTSAGGAGAAGGAGGAGVGLLSADKAASLFTDKHAKEL